MVLYDSLHSGNCYKARLLLAYRGIPYERVEIDSSVRSGRAALVGKSPSGRIPVLQLDDGRCLAESNAIVWYLADGTPLIPNDGFARAQALQWMFFEQYEHEPAIAVARFLSHFARDEDRNADRLAACRARGRAVLTIMDKYLADRLFFVGDAATVADVVLYAYTHVADEGGFDLAEYPHVNAWLRRVAAEPWYVAMRQPS